MKKKYTAPEITVEKLDLQFSLRITSPDPPVGPNESAPVAPSRPIPPHQQRFEDREW